MPRHRTSGMVSVVPHAQDEDALPEIMQPVVFDEERVNRDLSSLWDVLGSRQKKWVRAYLEEGTYAKASAKIGTAPKHRSTEAYSMSHTPRVKEFIRNYLGDWVREANSFVPSIDGPRAPVVHFAPAPGQLLRAVPGERTSMLPAVDVIHPSALVGNAIQTMEDIRALPRLSRDSLARYLGSVGIGVVPGFSDRARIAALTLFAKIEGFDLPTAPTTERAVAKQVTEAYRTDPTIRAAVDKLNTRMLEIRAEMSANTADIEARADAVFGPSPDRPIVLAPPLTPVQAHEDGPQTTEVLLPGQSPMGAEDDDEDEDGGV